MRAKPLENTCKQIFGYRKLTLKPSTNAEVGWYSYIRTGFVPTSRQTDVYKFQSFVSFQILLLRSICPRMWTRYNLWRILFYFIVHYLLVYCWFYSQIFKTGFMYLSNICLLYTFSFVFYFPHDLRIIENNFLFSYLNTLHKDLNLALEKIRNPKSYIYDSNRCSNWNI